MYLLDTNVVSELRKPKPHGAVLQWIQDVSDTDLHVSAVTIGEIQAGIELTRDQDEPKAAELEQWLEMVSGTFNVIPMDAPAFRVWARLMHKASDTLYEDAMIAATAKVHKFTVVTRNVADFKHFGVTVLNPFVSARKWLTADEVRPFDAGAKSAVMTAHKRNDPISQWLVQLKERVGWQKAVVALANKNARILWCVMTRGERFDPHHVPTRAAATPSATPCATSAWNTQLNWHDLWIWPDQRFISWAEEKHQQARY